MLLRLFDITVAYDRLIAVREANLTLEEGEIVAVLGANGAGKSSLLGAVAGLLPVRSGKVLLEDREVTGWNTYRMVRSGVCLVPEGRHVVGSMTVEENLLLGTVKREQSGCLDEIYRQMPVLGERRGQAAGLLSGGEQQMLAIARAMMSQPRLLLIDEPTLGLSPKMAKKILTMITALREERKAILLVEQNVRQALKIADRVYRMEKGRLTEGRPGETQDSADAFYAF